MIRPSVAHRVLNLVQAGLLIAAMGLVLWFSVSAVTGGMAPWLVVGALAFGLVLLPSLSKRMILSAYRARPLGPVEFPAGVRLMQALAERAELPASPVLFWIPSPLPNAFAIGSPSESAVCVTDGLLKLMSAREFAGVLAHEVSHIANRDLWIMGLADIMSRVVSVVSWLGQMLLLISLPFLLSGEVVLPWHLPLLLIFAPSLMGLMQLALSRNRENDADLSAAGLTGDPEGLATALIKLDRRVGRFWEEIFLPGRRIPEPSLLRTHPPTGERVARLRALRLKRDEAFPAADPVSARMRPVARRAGFRGPGLFYY